MADKWPMVRSGRDGLVADTPIPHQRVGLNDREIEAYGGYLLCESISGLVMERLANAWNAAVIVDLQAENRIMAAAIEGAAETLESIFLDFNHVCGDADKTPFTIPYEDADAARMAIYRLRKGLG